MPYSDNMYSFNEESDGEDHANRPSPSNDRFPFSSPGATPVIPNIFILDPTLRQGPESGSESKVSKTDEEELLNSQLEYGYRSSASFSSLSPGCPEHTTTATGTILPRHHYQVACLQPSVSPSSSQSLPGPTQSPSVYSDAPPAYSPSPNSLFSFRSSSSQQDLPSNYRTFRVGSIMGQEVESERLLGSQPESMGQPVDEERDTRPWARRARRHLPGWLRWKHALLALVTLIVSVAFLSGIASSGPNKPNDPTTRPALPIDERPPSEVPDDGSGIPGSSGSPNDPLSPGLPFQSSFCEGRQYPYDNQELSVDFERSHNLTFKEGVYRNPGSKRVRVGGRIDVRRLKEGDGDPRVVLEIATNDPSLRLYTSLDADSQEIEINIPETFESSVPGQRPCVELRGAVWAPKDAELGILSLHAIHLDILLSNDLSLRVADYTALSSVTGDIKAAVNIPASYGKISDSLLSNLDYTFVPASESWRFDSRVIEVRTTAGSIAGNWPLYDLLGLHTTSGSLEVSITPQEELKSKPKPAVLSLSTISGAISATEPVHEPNAIPRRDYLVDVKSISGSVHGALVFGAGATVHATASEVSLDLLPVIDVAKITPQDPAQLETATTSGATAVRILEPLFFNGTGGALTAEDLVKEASGALDCLEAKHKSTSGNIGLRYPQSWEGLLYAQTTTGRLVAKGRDLKVIKFEGGWPGSKMEARKGAVGKKSTIEVHVLLGEMNALIGDE